MNLHSSLISVAELITHLDHLQQMEKKICEDFNGGGWKLNNEVKVCGWFILGTELDSGAQEVIRS